MALDEISPTVRLSGRSRRVSMLARFNRQRRLTLIGAMAAVIATASPAWAPPGDLDTTFGNGGRVITDFGFEDEAHAVAIQGDGKIVAAGSAADSQGLPEFFALARYNTDGSLDFSFGPNGTVITDLAPGFDRAFGVVIQPDGKLVTAGCVSCFSASAEFALVRYNSNGSLDTSFDGDGIVTTDFVGDEDLASDVTIQADGKIVAAGTVLVSGIGYDFGVARYNSDGSLDSTFDGDGRVTTDLSFNDDHAHDVAIQQDGNILVVGTADVQQFALARYLTDGSLDATFDGDGIVTTDFDGSEDRALGIAIQGDGKIVAAGLAEIAGNYDFGLARYLTDGSLDLTFDSDGKATTDFGGGDHAGGVAIQGDGRIVAAGSTDTFPAPDFALARYRTDGSLDPLFSGDGMVTTDFDYQDRANAIALQADGKIVAVGTASHPATIDDFALARYTVCRRTSRRASVPFCP
jgi:uncharacterized delta-60 repeat protein